MKTYFILFALLGFYNFGNCQLDQFPAFMNPLLSEPHENGFMNFQKPNSINPGACFQNYKSTLSDADNDMILVETKTDTEQSSTFHTHYKYIQSYKHVPVELGGCIEHFDSEGNLVFMNSKHVVNLNDDAIPTLDQDAALTQLLLQLPLDLEYAWLDQILEADYQQDMGDPFASRKPIPELMYAIDAFNDLGFNIDGSRYTLAYRIKLTTLNPFNTTYYFINADTGVIFREQSHHDSNGPANVVGYGVQNIDTQWFGGFTQAHVLYANDESRNIHTKFKDGGSEMPSWVLIQNVTDDDDDWGVDHLTEQTAHYFASLSWDFYRQRFGRIGMDDNGTEVRVRTGWIDLGAEFDATKPKPLIQFGQSLTGDNMAHEPSIVGHEYTHGVSEYTAGFAFEYEPGALDESFSDMFGIVIQATMLDGGTTDWIAGNAITGAQPRNLSDPHASTVAQPDTYLGDYWGTGAGDRHTNSGVGNYWFYLLTEGDNGFNDNGNSYSVSGIGMLKSSWIAYYALTNILQSASEYPDARSATVQAAKILYGECSVEYQETIDAWAAVGVGDEHECTYTLDVSDELTNESDVNIYPNPATSAIKVEVPFASMKVIMIYDMYGKLVESLENSKLVTSIDVGHLSNGMYTFLLNINGQVVVKKVMIH